MSCCRIYFFYNLLFYLLITGQSVLDKDEYYVTAMNALDQNDFTKAEEYLEKSIREYETPDSYYQLAQINLQMGSHVHRAKALRLLKKSVWKEPDNLKYRMAYAELLEDFSKFSAIAQYQRIVEMDTSVSKAWLNLAEIKRKEFDDFYNSVGDMGSGIFAPLSEYALEDFDESEMYYKKALAVNPESVEILLKLGKLYERKDSVKGAIEIFNKLVNVDPSNKDGHLYLGLCCNYSGEYKLANNEFKKAISLMDYDEREDFTFNSVVEMIEPVFNGLKDEDNRWYVKRIINAYWKMSDPINEKGINERLVEHYARVAYANLHFSVENMGIIGWKSDRGQTVVRYGIPKRKVRIRPTFGGNKIVMKTEVWNYDDMTFAFTDQFSSGNFQYSAPMGEKSRFVSHFAGDSHTYAQHVKNVKHQNYDPVFMGEPLEIHYDILQFMNNEKSSVTDVYLVYSYATTDTIQSEISPADHIIHVDYFDELFDNVYSNEEVISYKNTYTHPGSEENLIISKIEIPLQPDSGMMSFKVKRLIDNSWTNIISRLKVRNFNTKDLAVSDVMFARSINSDESYCKIQRGGNSISPLTTEQIKLIRDNSIYYEIYNLKKAKNNLTDYIIEIKIININEGGFLNGLASVFEGVMESIGITDDNSITLSGNYQSQETNQFIDLQLNLSQLVSGRYRITVTVKDKISGEAVCNSKEFLLN